MVVHAGAKFLNFFFPALFIISPKTAYMTNSVFSAKDLFSELIFYLNVRCARDHFQQVFIYHFFANFYFGR